MRLPDFLAFEPFNRLRDTMGAETLGHFVFFDPKRHITGLERLSLGAVGLSVPLSDVRSLNDFTLAYKDCRVLLYPVLTPAAEAGLAAYHLADCVEVQALWKDNPVSQVTGSREWRIAASGTQLPAADYRVCRQCLQRLRYQDFDAVRQRHKEYSERVEQAFDLDDFFRRYPCYPLADTQSAPLF